MGVSHNQINVFIINPQDIKGIYDLFPKYISRNDIYEERELKKNVLLERSIL